MSEQKEGRGLRASIVSGVVVGVVVAVLVSILFTIWGWVRETPQQVLEVLVPTDAVVAFALKECPSGWEPYEPAYGRFIRGIDLSEQGRDPDGRRDIGAPQDDSLAGHSHKYFTYDNDQSPNRAGKDGNDRFSAPRIDTYEETGKTSLVGSSETRPKNVALLFCRKE